MNEQPGSAFREEGGPDQEAIRLQLARILASPLFVSAPSLGRMLSYVVEQSLAGEAGRLKEYTLGVEVFGRGDDFDQRQDTIVRVQGRRLRDRLVAYYREQGADDPVGISLPKGHYVPTYQWRVLPAPACDKAHECPRKPRQWAPVVMMLALASLLVLGIAAGLDGSRQHPAPGAGSTPHRIAVLPFTNMSPNRDHEYLADGLTEELIHRLAQSPSLQVTARTSSFAFKDRAEDIRTVARTLGVDHVIEGSVRYDGERLRITVQLINAASGVHLWSQTYDRRPVDLFALQGEIAEAAATTLRASTRPRQAATAVSPDPEAYALYLRARFHLNRRGKGDVTRAETMLRQAIGVDPAFAPAWGALASALFYQTAEGGLAWDTGMQQSEAAARRALTLDPNLVEARLRLAARLFWADDRDGAVAELERAWRLDPDNPLGLAMAANVAKSQLQPELAIELQRRALTRDPLATAMSMTLATTLAEDGQFDAADAEIRRLVEIYPQHRPEVELLRVRMRILQHRPDEALRLLLRLPESVSGRHLLALAHAGVGNRQRAEEAMAVLPGPRWSDPHPAVTRAEAWMLLGEPERALAALLRVRPDIRTVDGKHERSMLKEARVSRLLRPLHADPRWQAWTREALDLYEPVDLSPLLGAAEPAG